LFSFVFVIYRKQRKEWEGKTKKDKGKHNKGMGRGDERKQNKGKNGKGRQKKTRENICYIPEQVVIGFKRFAASFNTACMRRSRR
jgi:hypothetical protein